MNFLAATNQANDYSPVLVPVHAGYQELGFGLSEIGLLLLPQHKAGGLLKIPRALGFIEDDNVFGGRARIEQGLVAEMVNILDERLHALACSPFLHLLPP